MLNPSMFTCVTRTDFGQNIQSILQKRHLDVFGKYKESEPVFHDFAALMINHMPANLLSFLADEDLEGLFKYLFGILEGRKRKKVSIMADDLSEKSFFVGNFSLITVITDDRPFLYDSVWAYFQEIGFKNLFIVHPILNVRRDRTGAVAEVSDTTIGSKNESFFMIFLENSEEGRIKEIVSELTSVYECVCSAVDDFHKITELMRNMTTEIRESEPEVSRFIHWLLQDNFIFHGAQVINIYRDKKALDSSELGIYRIYSDTPQLDTMLGYLDNSRFNFVEGYPVIVDKSLLKSRMKVRGHLNRIIFVDQHGTFVRIIRVLGLFTYKGRRAQPHEIPIIRDKVRETLEHFNFVQGSHDYKWVRSLIDDFPKVELFNFNRRLLTETLELILSMQGTGQMRICYRDFRPLNNMFFFIAMPSEKYSSELIADMQDFLRSFFNARILDTSIREDEHKRYYLHFHLFLEDSSLLDRIDDSALKTGILSLMRDWETNLYDILRDRLEADEIDKVYHKYVDRFTETYKSRNTPEAAYADISVMEGPKEVRSRVYTENSRAVLKIYTPERFLLTQLMPVLDNIGLKVYEEDTYHFSLYEGDRYINSVYFADIDDPEDFCERYKENLPQLVVNVLTGNVENDRLNSLSISRALNYRQIGFLRAIRNFIRQIDTSFTIVTLSNALINNPETALLLVRMFESKFAPDVKEFDSDTFSADILGMIDKVVSAAEDKALRYYLQVLGAMVRTNYFRIPERPYISFKIKSRELDIIPEPRPLFEIFVHSAQMDGVHLRGGKVARGGLRFSDRLDDYRTEILGLVKTQMVKNAVIVPVGSKGGFIVKNRLKDKQQDKDNVVAQYKNYIRSLLDITDNIKGAKIVHPDRVKVYDDKDPYLVVAADKGTATFSDIANSVSVETGFWLGDAFASGGSAGYDHKKVGITARGAWECVKRHFRELGKDIQKEEFTVYGIGDMSGDVFGNGMLLSRKILLQAAFNHMHIFLDPSPDAERSFKERERLFKLSTAATWADYDTSIISDGGGIFMRSAKKIELDYTVRQMLETDRSAVTGDELVNLILRMKAELMWNGGIGTYVRATSETNAQVGDPSNDAVRITATELRATVVGEGGNLGFTQRARIEYAEHGGRINTDALDNSAGVDMSDHEVNLKIMFSRLMKDGLLADMADRNRYIRKLTRDVADHVLRDNYLQSGCISMAQRGYEMNPVVYREFANYLKDRKLIDFNIEKLDFPMLDRAPTRPELCVLLAYSKIFLYGEIEAGLNIDDELVRREYISYYPADMQKRFGDVLYDHILVREIAATVIVNRLINQAGPVFFYEMYKNTAIDFLRLTDAYLLAEDILGLKPLRVELEKLDASADNAALSEAYLELERTMRVAVPWVADEHRAKALLDGKAGFDEIVRMTPRYMSKSVKTNYESMMDSFEQRGIPHAVARQICDIRYSKAAFDIFEVCLKTGSPVKQVLQAYFEADTLLSVTPLTSGMKEQKIRTEWERINMESLLSRIKTLQKKIAANTCAHGKGWLENLMRSEKTFFENYNSFLLSVSNRDIDSLVPYNVVADMFTRLLGRFEDN